MDFAAEVPCNGRPIPRKPSTRRFPGPAGLLPVLSASEFVQLDAPKRKKNQISERIDILISSEGAIMAPPYSTPSQCYPQSQIQGSIFEESTWLTLLEQLGLSQNDSNPNNLMNFMNIDWILTKAVKLPRPYIKIPFLAAVLQETHSIVGKLGIGTYNSCANPRITLADPTGTIEATVDPAFLEACEEDINAGTSFALKNVPILHHKRSGILTITSTNVICMTSRAENTTPKQIKGTLPVKSREIKGNVIVTCLSEFDPQQLIKDFHFLNLPDLDGDLNDEDDENDIPAKRRLISQSESSNPRIPNSHTHDQRNKFGFQWRKNDLNKSLDRSYKTPRPPYQSHHTVPQTSDFVAFREASAVLSNSFEENAVDDQDDEIFRLLQVGDDKIAEAQPRAGQTVISKLNSTPTKSSDVGNSVENFTDSDMEAGDETEVPPCNSYIEGDMPCESGEDEEFLSLDEDYRESAGVSSKSENVESGEMPDESDDEIFSFCESNPLPSITRLHQSEIEGCVPRSPPPIIPNTDYTSNLQGSMEDDSFGDDEDEFFNVLAGMDKKG